MEIKKLSLQDIFNAAWQRFVVEEEDGAANDMSSCVYRSEDGNMCAIGCALPQELLDKLIAYGNNTNTSFPKLVLRYKEYFQDDVIKLAERYTPLVIFQSRLHDNLLNILGNSDYTSRIMIEGTYRVIANRFGLTVPEETSSFMKDE